MEKINVYFSDFFNINESVVDDYGAINISLLNDLPLFVDPFLLFNSTKEEYINIHNEIIRYLLFLQGQAQKYSTIPPGMLSSWYFFPEVKQTWLGFSLNGNGGRGMGRTFAINLHRSFQNVFSDFGKETITKSSHLEKLCLISPLIGRDKISDFTTNFVKKYILEYTEEFALKNLKSNQCKKFTVPKVEFNYSTYTWMSKEYLLPTIYDDFILLTPRDLLTRDETFINRNDMVRNLQNIVPSIDDASLRFQLNHYLTDVLLKSRKELSKSEKDRIAITLISTYPKLVDYYIRYKENNEKDATSISEKLVGQTKVLFNNQLQELVSLLQSKTPFYTEDPLSYNESYKRVLYLKDVIENMDGYRIFYIDGKPLRRENDLQIMYKLVWCATSFDVNREPNNGRGPVDFKVSKGIHNMSLVEFKLASNPKLKRNIQHQVDIYKKANGTDRAIKVILYFTDAELNKVNSIINNLGLAGCKDIILIDARNNKISASNA